MNYKVTSRDEILRQARQIIAEQGMPALSIRSLSKRCGMAVGSMYNYFPSKDSMVLAVVQSVWEDVFHLDRLEESSFSAVVREVLLHIEEGRKTYPNFFKLHALEISEDAKGGGKRFMTEFFKEMTETLLSILEGDEYLKDGVFDENFTKRGYVDFVVNVLLSSFIRKIDEQMIIATIETTIY